MLTGHIQLIDSEAVIKTKMLNIVASQIRRRFNSRGGQARVRDMVREALCRELNMSPTIQSLLGGELRAELGLVEGGSIATTPVQRINTIIDTVVHGVKIHIKPFVASASSIVGSVQVYGVPYDHQDVLGLPEAIQENIRGSKYGPPFFEWLSWLLEYGDQIAVVGHYVAKGGPKWLLEKYSRTGLAIMRPGGQGWRVPADHTGVLGNNFITKAVDRILQNDIPSLFRNMF